MFNAVFIKSLNNIFFVISLDKEKNLKIYFLL